MEKIKKMKIILDVLSVDGVLCVIKWVCGLNENLTYITWSASSQEDVLFVPTEK